MHCAACGSANVSARFDVDKFQYLDNGKMVNLTAPVRVLTCGTCDFQYTESEAEDARAKSIRFYLWNKEHALAV